MTAWRNSASLILAARQAQKYNGTVSPTIYNYNLLCLKRHHKSDFMPGTYVFPGGVVDPADSDLKWREYFATFGFDNGSFAVLVPKAAVRPQIFQARPNELPGEISLRITAIRETFEECGVLVCRRKSDDRAPPAPWSHHVSVPRSELRSWQSKVHEDATEFLKLCERLDCYPDLWALHEWSNWLTPTRMKKRYDTVFYLACLPFAAHAEYESIEMEDLKWETPGSLLSSADVTLPPPQQYEITKLAEFKSVENLLDFAVERSKAGVQLWLPVAVYLKDGVVIVLPGDAMYPKEVSLVDKQEIDRSDITVDEFRELTPTTNRIEFADEQLKIVRTDNVRTRDSQTKFMSQGIGKPHVKSKV